MATIISLICFAVAAVIGMALAAMYQKGKLSMNGAIAHGVFGAAGLIFLIVAAVRQTLSTLGIAALVIFIIATFGGAVLLASDLKKGKLPKPLIAVHGAAAVIAFLLLLFGSIG